MNPSSTILTSQGIPSTHILGALISPEAGTEFSNAQQPKINLSHREKL